MTLSEMQCEPFYILLPLDYNHNVHRRLYLPPISFLRAKILLCNVDFYLLKPRLLFGSGKLLNIEPCGDNRTP